MLQLLLLLTLDGLMRQAKIFSFFSAFLLFF